MGGAKVDANHPRHAAEVELRIELSVNGLPDASATLLGWCEQLAAKGGLHTESAGIGRGESILRVQSLGGLKCEDDRVHVMASATYEWETFETPTVSRIRRIRTLLSRSDQRALREVVWRPVNEPAANEALVIDARASVVRAFCQDVEPSEIKLTVTRLTEPTWHGPHEKLTAERCERWSDLLTWEPDVSTSDAEDKDPKRLVWEGSLEDISSEVGAFGDGVFIEELEPSRLSLREGRIAMRSPGILWVSPLSMPMPNEKEERHPLVVAWTALT